MMLRSLALLLVLAACHAAPARANDIRIYHGVVDSGTFSSGGNDLRKQRLYLIVDHTAFQIALIYYDPETRTHTESIVGVNLDAVRPSSADPKAVRFVYAGAPDPGGTPVDVYRLRSVGKLALQPVSSSAAERVAKRFAYTYYHLALAAFNHEEVGTLKYQKKLTIAANDVFHDTATAIELVLDDLRARDVVD